MRAKALGCLLLFASAAAVVKAQNFTSTPCNSSDGDSESSWFSGRQQRACEIRRATLRLTNDQLSVSGRNGGIEVVGEDRSDIALEVKVTANGSSRENAESVLKEIRIVTEGSSIRAEGPSESGSWLHGGGWSASYRLRVPRHIARTELRTSNGGINISNLDGQVNAASSNGGIEIGHVKGDVNASTTNGGLQLNELAGAVHAQTTNGGVHISLAGDRWQGSGLFARSTNGAITLKAPDRFAAHLVADTTNGGISVGFPITVQGKIGKHLDTVVNGGGPTVQLETTNGGVSIDRM